MSHGDSGGGDCSSGQKCEDKELNMAAWIPGVKDLAIQPYPLSSLGPHDVKVRIKAMGICGSDVHYYKTMRSANFIATKPLVRGHESTGIIEEVGIEVTSLAVKSKGQGGFGAWNQLPKMQFLQRWPLQSMSPDKIFWLCLCINSQFPHFD